MQIDYLDYLPDEFRASAITLYFNALSEKLEPILGSDERAKKALGSHIATNKCIAAICDGGSPAFWAFRRTKADL